MEMSEQERLWYRVARLEKAIRDKFGDLPVSNFKKYWTNENEQSYLEQLKELWAKKYSLKIKTEEVEEKKGYLVKRKLFKKRQNEYRCCSVCKSYSFEIKDEYYFNKFDCCFICYIQWIEDRVERWNSGWRPNL
jgi:hypothetical protein